MRSIAILLLTTALPIFAQQQPCSSPTGRAVTVNGSATIRVVPDRVAFTVGVETDAASVATAFKTNTEKLDAVLQALKAAGVKSEQIETSNFAITSKDYEGKKLPGYRVTNFVT